MRPWIAAAALIGLIAAPCVGQSAKEPTGAEAKDVVAKDMAEMARLNRQGKSARNYLGTVAKEHFASWRKAEDLGVTEGMYLVGRAYEHGLVVTQDYAEAMNRFQKAAEKGSHLAEAEVAELYGHGLGVKRDDVEALTWWRRAADAGELVAMNNVGWCYDTGRGVTKDSAEAMKWFRKAADVGYAGAMTNLGRCYRQGRGVAKDPVEGMKWFRKAADAGDDEALIEIGNSYLRGMGVEEDEAEAVKWFRRSAESGSAAGQLKLGGCYDHGNGVPIDKVEAARWFRMSAEQGNWAAQRDLGMACQFGWGIPQDYAQAVNWYRKAAAQGDEVSQYNLAWCCLSGEGTAQNRFEAATFFHKAADRGYMEGQYWYGWCLQNGVGAGKNEVEAAKWYRKAADTGYTKARYRLGQCYQFGIGVKENHEDAKWWFYLGSQPGVPYSRWTLRDQHRAFLTRVVVDAYEKRPGKDPRWAEQGLAFLRYVVHDEDAGGEEPGYWEWVREAADKGRTAINAGCDDPMVLFWYDDVLSRMGKDDGVTYCAAALKGFEAGQYTVDFACRAARRLFYDHAVDASQKDRLEKLFRDSVIATMVRGPYQAGEQRLLFKHFANPLGREDIGTLETIYDAVKDAKGADPWSVHLLAGRLYIEKAWDCRSDADASKVTDAQWKGFNENLQKAQEHLAKAWELNRKAPEVPVLMMRVPMATAGVKDVLLWFQRATVADLEYEPTYSQARWALRPRWGGSYELLIQLGDACVKTGRFDTNVPFELFWAAGDIADEMRGDWVKALSIGGLYGKLQDMLDKYMAANPKKTRWALSIKTALAWRMSKWDEAAKYLEQGNHDLINTAFWIVGGPLEAYKEIDQHVPPRPK